MAETQIKVASSLPRLSELLKLTMAHRLTHLNLRAHVVLLLFKAKKHVFHFHSIALLEQSPCSGGDCSILSYWLLRIPWQVWFQMLKLAAIYQNPSGSSYMILRKFCCCWVWLFSLLVFYVHGLLRNAAVNILQAENPSVTLLQHVSVLSRRSVPVLPYRSF